MQILVIFAGLTWLTSSPLTEDDLRNRINSLRRVAIRGDEQRGRSLVCLVAGVVAGTPFI